MNEYLNDNIEGRYFKKDFDIWELSPSYLGRYEGRSIGIFAESLLLGRSKMARGGDEAVFTCPNCNHHKKKLTLNKLTQKYQCWVCGFKGARALQLLKFIKAPYTAFQELQSIDAQYKF